MSRTRPAPVVEMLPHDLDAEKRLLVAIVFHEASHVVREVGLLPEMFYRLAYQPLVSAAFELCDEGLTPTLDLVVSRLSDAELKTLGGAFGVDALRDGSPRQPAENLRYYARQVIDAHERREQIARLDRARAIVLDTSSTHTEIADAIGSISMAIRERDASEALVITSMDTVTARTVEFIRRGWLSPGALTLLAGNPGGGKTMVACDLVARVSRGTAWPEGGVAPRGPVLYVGSEDDLETTIKPRLDAAGADSKLVHAVRGVGMGGAVVRGVTFRDLPMLDKAVTEKGATGLVLDPIVDLVDGAVDDHKNKELRRELMPFVQWLQSRRLWALGIAHTNKSNTGAPIHRVLGSLAYVGVARIVLAAAKDHNDPERHIIATVKNNLGPWAPALAFRIVDARADWEAGTLDGVTAEELWTPTPAAEAATDTVSWLREFLLNREAEGVLSETIFREGRLAGHGRNRIYGAKDTLGIKPRPAGARGQWRWSLPYTTDEQTSRLSSLPSTHQEDREVGEVREDGDPNSPNLPNLPNLPKLLLPYARANGREVTEMEAPV